MGEGPTTILVVDDSALYRQSISNVLRDVPQARVIGTARDGVEALARIEALDPDLLTLDVQMPDMNGIEVLRQIKQRRLRAKAIMVSSFTSQGAEVTTQALMEGAFDLILKPATSDSETNRQQLKAALLEKIAAFREGEGRKSRAALPGDTNSDSVPMPQAACRLVLIGSSTGGPEALKTVLPRLPASLTVPVLVAQHMPAQFTRSLAARLHDISELPVAEAQDQGKALPGQVLIAPGGKQMRIERVRNCLVTRVTEDPAENGVKPSVDYLLRSVVEVLDGQALAVILTGMGRDGLDGCRQLKQAGGYVFAQCQQDCVVYGMPKAVIEQQLADRVLPLGKIAPAIARHVKRSRRC